MPTTPSRRALLKSCGAASLLAGTGLWRPAAWAIDTHHDALTGSQFDLWIGEAPVNFSGTPRTAMTINGGIPGPLLRWREGETVTIRVRNRLQQETSIHWHGIILPANMDGVPGLSFAGIAPGGLYEYRFKLQQNGTYWYHSHSGLQEQAGVYGPLEIDAKEPEPFHYDREFVVMLSDWTDENPTRVLAKLKKQYRVLGHPSVIMLGPSGEVIGRYRGYKRGDANYLWGQIKHAVNVATESRRQWRSDLEAKGYREWKDRSGRSVCAKLTGYATGNLPLIEPDGTRSKTREDRLSDADRQLRI